MRSLLSVLVLLLAAGAVAWVVLDEQDEGAGDGAVLEGGADPVDDGGESGPLRVEAGAVVGVYGQDGGAPTRPLDFGTAMQTPVRLPSAGGRLTGADVLDALAEQVGAALPIRFASRAALEGCRSTALGVEERPPEVDVPMLLDWLRHAGWVAEQRETFLFLRRAEPGPR